MMENPWNVGSFQDFLFYNCPECIFKTKAVKLLEEHAVCNHASNYTKANQDETSSDCDFTEDEAEKPLWHCQYCDRQFLLQPSLQEHFHQKHSRESRFDCDMCHFKSNVPLVTEQHKQGGYCVNTLPENQSEEETIKAITSQPLHNPLEIEDDDHDKDFVNITPACTRLKKQTLKKYKRTWKEFKRIANVKQDSEPTQEDFAKYLTIKGEGSSHNTLKVTYAHLNKMYKLIFKKQLSDYPELNKLLDSHIDADANAKKTSKRFTRQQLFQFLREADDSNPQMLIRKVAAIMSFSGGISLQECRKLTMDSLKPCDNGYILKCENIMQRAHLHYGPTKLIPRYDEDGVSFARILDIYFESLTVDKVKTHGASPLIYSTRSFKNKGFQFCDSAMGKNTLIGLGKDIAAFLKLEEPELYTGLCFVQKNSKM